VNDASPICWFCDEQIDNGAVPAFSDGEERAHRSCLDDCADAAEERSIADFYGASTPQTEAERGREAAETKRRLS
jgi:hypothetical protein